ncbi:hypothetical protein ACLOJK_019041 [Asimina triloba]
MADAVVSILLEKLVTFLIDEDRFDGIRNEFQHLQNYIKDVERVKRRDRTETLKLIMTNIIDRPTPTTTDVGAASCYPTKSILPAPPPWSIFPAG